eukprot:scaffold323992_cov174-Tisochrysis_lutea.AAC.1
MMIRAAEGARDWVFLALMARMLAKATNANRLLRRRLVTLSGSGSSRAARRNEDVGHWSPGAELGTDL